MINEYSKLLPKEMLEDIYKVKFTFMSFGKGINIKYKVEDGLEFETSILSYKKLFFDCINYLTRRGFVVNYFSTPDGKYSCSIDNKGYKKSFVSNEDELLPVFVLVNAIWSETLNEPEAI